MAQYTGNCIYCGQGQTIHTSSELEQEQVNMLVSQRCGCAGAMRANNRSEIMDRIDKLFGPDCSVLGFDYACDVHQRSGLAEIAEHVLDELYDEAKIKLPNGDTATFKLVGNELEISREMKRKRTA